MRSIFVSTLAVIAASLHAQTAPQPEVRLEPHDGKVRFQIGEPIRLDLVISNPTSAPMMVNATDYGDNSDPVEISPKLGWIAWQGRSGHDYAMMSPLGKEPIRIPIRVDQVAIFREPGHYEVSATEDRVQFGSDLLHISRAQAITTNAVGIDLETMPDGRETEIVSGVVSDLTISTDDRTGASLRDAAVRRLAVLQGDTALDEKVKLLIAEQEDFRAVESEAWATTRDLKRQLELLEAAWHDPRITPAYDMPTALDETRRLLAGVPLSGWQMAVASREPNEVEQQLAAAHQQDMVDLLNSMPQRTGESRSYGAYFLVEFGGLPEIDQARAHEYAAEEFALMDDTAQHMLLETSRLPLRDARLLPTLRALLDHNPADKDALAAYLDLALEEAAPFVVRAVCAPDGPPLIDTFAKIEEDRLPQVDACLLPLLQGQKPDGSASTADFTRKKSGRVNFVWKQRVTLAARFGTPALLPAIESSEAQQLAANPNDSGVAGALLAAEMRDKPNAALLRLQQGVLPVIAWFETNEVYKSANQPFPPAIQAWLREQIRSGDDRSAGMAAYELSIGGAAEDHALIEQRLADLRSNTPGTLTGTSSAIEADLVSSLFNAKVWTLTPEERGAVTQGCVTDGCRNFIKK